MRWLLLLCVATQLHAQDTVRVKHSNYETVFSTSLRYPILVEWWDTKEKIGCKVPVKREDKFIPDPKLPKESNVTDAYVGSGFDRGHISPAADNQCVGKQGMEESFYFTNMAPQYPGLNRGQWKRLEMITRNTALQFDSVHVRAGCVGETKKLKNVLSVPSYCWKILIIKKTNDTLAYVFPNKPEKTNSLEQHRVTLDSVRKLTQIKF
jgi:endonuclease G